MVISPAILHGAAETLAANAAALELHAERHDRTATLVTTVAADSDRVGTGPRVATIRRVLPRVPDASGRAAGELRRAAQSCRRLAQDASQLADELTRLQQRRRELESRRGTLQVQASHDPAYQASLTEVTRLCQQTVTAEASVQTRWLDRQRQAATEVDAATSGVRTAQTVLASSDGTDTSAVGGFLRGLLAEFNIHGASEDARTSTVLISRAVAANRVRRVVGFLRTMPPLHSARLEQVPTFANSPMLVRAAQREGRLGRLARPLTSPTAQVFARRLGIAGGVYGTVTGTADLIRQGNPVEAFRERGTHYAEDVAGTAFSAASVALLVAPNPVTAGAFVVTGAAYVGLSVWNRREQIAQGARNAVSAVGRGLDRAANAVASSAPVAQVLDTGRSLVNGATSTLRRLNPFGR